MDKKKLDPKKALVILEQRLPKELQLEIKTGDQLIIATQQRTHLFALTKEIGKKKGSILDPLNEAVKNVRALFKPIEIKAANQLARIGSAIDDYYLEAQRKQEAKQRELEQKVESGQITEKQAAKRLVKFEEQQATDLVKTRTIDVVVVEDENKVPDQYWVLDMVAVRRDALKGVKIPGVVVQPQTSSVNG